jgi:glutathione synthase/RimK-type ligase-like ATP-grasp enzyme
MKNLIVVEQEADWPRSVAGAEIVEAKRYLTAPELQELKRVQVFNLCRSFRYQSVGYYVSLLAEARGHKPLANVQTLQDFKTPGIARALADEMEETVEKALARATETEVTLTVAFGQSLDGRHPQIAQRLFRHFPAPLFRASFARNPRTGRWGLGGVSPLPLSQVPETWREALAGHAERYFSSRNGITRRRKPARFDLAILHDPQDVEPPSDPRALQRFVDAAESLDVEVDLIQKDDYNRLPEYDALFIRETTHVNHHTYRFARRAVAEGMPVIDDPTSIFRCTNKVFLAELLARHAVPMPQTLVVHRNNVERIIPTLGLPVVLKRPDSAFSHGVMRCETRDALESALKEMFAHSDLLIAQRYVPTAFDWRVGVFDRRPLFVCQYFMAPQHWQIIKRDAAGRRRNGQHRSIPLTDAPPAVIETAVKAANLIGDGLYGVDLKQLPDGVVVMEVNDNPNIDAGVEDSVLGNALYKQIVEGFVRRIEALRRLGRRP